MRPSAVLGHLVEELEFGQWKNDPLSFSIVATCLADDAAAVTPGPTAFFELDSSAVPAESAVAPIEVPVIPTPTSPERAGRGWSFAAWLKLHPAVHATPSDASGKTARPRGWQIAHFVSPGGGGEVEVWLAPTDSPQEYRLAVRCQLAASAGVFRGGKRAAIVEGGVRLSSAASAWHHVAVTQSVPFMALVTTSKVALYVDGRPAADGDVPLCPPLPFVQARFGTGFDGGLAHLQLYVI